jgi:hypothetical protein
MMEDWKRSISLYGNSARGTWREGSFTGTLKDIQMKALKTGISLSTDAPLGNLVGGFVYRRL